MFQIEDEINTREFSVRCAISECRQKYATQLGSRTRFVNPAHDLNTFKCVLNTTIYERPSFWSCVSTLFCFRAKLYTEYEVV